MSKLYLYKKFSEDGVSVKKIAENFIRQDDELYVVTDHDRKETALDKAMDTASAGDIFIIESLQDLGQDDKAIILHLRRCINKRIGLIICDLKSSYENGIALDINGIVLATVVELLSKANAEGSNVFRFRRNAGRPGTEFPDGWEDMYKAWKAGKVSSGDFMKWSGMKKATFYNKITEYRILLAQNEEYQNSVKASKTAE